VPIEVPGDNQSRSPSDLDQAVDIASQRFFAGAIDRIRYFMIGVAAVVLVALWWRFGLRTALGFAFGCAIAYLNFYWLKRVIGGFVERAAGATPSQSRQGIVSRFLLRYALMAGGAYAILTVSPASLNGLLVGLFLPVAAIACEAFYELYAALARGV
jgi:ATP synthase I chain